MGKQINSRGITLYFGDASEEFDATTYTTNCTDTCEKLESIKTKLNAETLNCAKQTHGTDVANLDHRALTFPIIDQEADILATSHPKRALGIYTADCLPIVMHDPINKNIAVVHAGWRGTLNGVVLAALEYMKKNFKTNPADVRVFFGPSALPCCYEFGSNFEDQIQALPYAHLYKLCLSTRNNKHYFNVPLCNIKQLLAGGIKESYIDTTCNLCTMCNEEFCSHRRAPGKRQVTVALLD
jgi:YfiH family protein